MKKVLYIGINTYGSTSKMRADRMRQILADWEMDIIDTDIPYTSMNHICRSLAFRWKIGPAIPIINKYIIKHIGDKHYNLIWVDKGIFVTRKTTEMLRRQTERLVHYTPDPAITYHRSKHFFKSMPLYDYVITTKSYELDDFYKLIGDKNKVLYCTQGFDKKIHRPIIPWEEKHGVALIGHHEVEREAPVTALLNAGIEVLLAGGKWDEYAKAHECPNLNYLGGSIEGEGYVKALSSCLFAWGAVSKWIPEKHTTRTFEIPACGTALLTEWNEEIAGFYKDDEVIFYKDIDDMVAKVKYYTKHTEILKMLVDKGYQKVQNGGFDFETIMRNLLNKVLA